MNSREAIRDLKSAGYSAKNGRGSHVILRNGDRVIIIPDGRMELSAGMTKKVQSHLRKKGTT